MSEDYVDLFKKALCKVTCTTVQDISAEQSRSDASGH